MRRKTTGRQGGIKLYYVMGGLMLFAIASVHMGAAQENTNPATPAFDVVSIRPYVAQATVAGGPIVFRSLECHYFPDRVQCSLTPEQFIEQAFKLKKMEVVGPASLMAHVFTLNATMPAGTENDTARLMLQRVLVDRFQLKYHYESRNIPAYALVPGKSGAKLQPAARDPNVREKEKVAAADAIGPRGRVQTVSNSEPMHLYFTGISLDMLATNLGFDADLPVVNATGLTGDYKIDISWSPSEDGEFRSRRFSDPEFLAALQQQAGLRLERRSMPVTVLVVDHIDSTPSEN